MTEFSIDARLAADTVAVGDGALSQVLMMNDARFPWLVLVPRRLHLVELADLPAADQQQLMSEIVQTARVLKQIAAADKINVGALGNLVAQLHVHVVARRRGDPAWPGSVWGLGGAVPYSSTDALQKATQFKTALGLT